MPREIRKRGKKHKKSPQQGFSEGQEPVREDYRPKESGEPSWIVTACKPSEDTHPEAPFGYVDPDVKAYFRTVDEQIQSWQEDRTQQSDEGADLDPNEGACLLCISASNTHCFLAAKRVFFIAALSEMSGKEKQLATDPDCSVILERMVYSMDDFVLRVFVDRLSGSWVLVPFHIHGTG